MFMEHLGLGKYLGMFSLLRWTLLLSALLPLILLALFVRTIFGVHTWNNLHPKDTTRR
jgi:hypothetical protein